MRGDPRTMTVLTPRSAAEAVRALAKNAGAVPLAGGTDLMVGWNMGLLNGRTIVDLSRVSDWKKIKASKSSLLIGSLVTHSEIQKNPIVRARFPLLIEACAVVGAAQIQNRGTLGGNIANASPAGDTFPPLAVYEARVHCAGPAGKRVVSIHQIFAGVKKTSLNPGELIEAIELPYPAKPPTRGLFRKVGTRAAQSISKTMFAGLLWLRPDGTVADVRLAFGSLAPTVKRLRSAEAFLSGKRLDAAVVARAGDLMASDVSPIDDIRSTRAYRAAVSRNLLVRFLEGGLR
jgi:CO/xanthine dehydrogenase FAD-binding subunit